MKILLVTEKCSPHETQRDGGAMLVSTIRAAFGDSLRIMQFGTNTDSVATWHFDYPSNLTNRFERRLANADFIIEKVKAIEQHFTHIIFIHVSMQFGLASLSLQEGIHIWTFPMFLTPSYIASGEHVPEKYFEIERLTLAGSKNILTPSHLEKRQLIEIYSVPEELIHVVPRGINTHLFAPKVRSFNGSPKFCSIGSIKPQKNTLGLVNLFAKICTQFPDSTLQIIGPVQDNEYYAHVCYEIQRLQLGGVIEFSGHIAHEEISSIIKDTHIHISTSMCETFGRSIFETLSCGLPNIARSTGNAAAEFLQHLPYARFVNDDIEAVNTITEILLNFSKLSTMALEIGKLYDDKMLSKLLIAKICNKNFMAISDFDGTLFHKNDSEKTNRCISAFQSFQVKVICSARPIHDLVKTLKSHNLEVDWIIGCSGSIITDGHGKLLSYTPIDLNDVIKLETLIPQTKRIEFEGAVLQIVAPTELLPNILGLRVEIYQGSAFIANWSASKLKAIHWLLDHINWSGQVQAFGDGPYDIEFLTYFDGVLINSPNYTNSQITLKKHEVENV